MKPNPLENGMRVYADGWPFVGDGDILEGMRVYANGEDMSSALIYHTSTSATWTARLKGPAGSFVTFDWGDGSTPTTLELATGGTDFIHDYSGAGAGTKVIRLYGALINISFLSVDHRNINTIFSLNILANLTTLRLNSNNISDISSLSGLTSLIYLYLHENPINYPLTGISWFTATSGIFRFDSTVDSSAKVDRWLIDLAAANWSNCVIYLNETNPDRTSASDAAIATLLVNGCTVYVNE